MLRIAAIQILSVLLILFAACSQTEEKIAGTSEEQKIMFKGEAQGTYFAVTYYAADTLVTPLMLDSVFKMVDKSVSAYDTTSILSRINNSDSTAVPDGIFTTVFRMSEIVSKATDGALDVTVGPLVSAWGFGFRKGIRPDSATVDSLKQLIGYQKVSIINGKLIREKPGMKLDFNAIAQGYTVDLLSCFLLSKGISRFLVDVGGEVYARGLKDGNTPWVIGIEQPASDAMGPQEIRATMELSGTSVSTSGNYRKYYEENGIRYSHTIDPASAYPVRHSLLSVSVKATSCALADALATAFMVMGVEKSLLWLEAHPGIEAYFIYSDEQGNIIDHATRGFVLKK
jgi:FAD:protein FMN transferase